MKAFPLRAVTPLGTAVSVLAIFLSTAAAANVPGSSGQTHSAYISEPSSCNPRVSFFARGTPDELLQQLSQRAGFRLHQVAQPPRRVEIEGSDSVENLLEEILGHRNWIIAHRHDADCDVPLISEVWVLSPGDASDSAKTPIAMPRTLKTDIEQVASEPAPDKRDVVQPSLATPQGRGRMSPAERIQEREQRRLDRQRAARSGGQGQ